MLAGARQRTDVKGLRDRAILALLTDLALRRAEVAGLDVEHIDLSAGTVRVLRKNNRERVTLALTPAVVRALRAWLDVRPGAATGPLFVALDPGADGARLSPGAIYAIVRSLGFRAGAATSPHRIRHSAVTAAVRGAAAAGLSLADVTQYSGHRNAVTLQRYVDADPNVQGRLAAIVSATIAGEQER
jgi:integrase/recombinase XerC